MTLHHTIKDRVSSKLLLIRQWAERVNHENIELQNDIFAAKDSNDETAIKRAAREYDIWGERWEQDMKRYRDRLFEDGYEAVRIVTTEEAAALDDGDYQFSLSFISEAGKLVSPTQFHLWQRKALRGE